MNPNKRPVPGFFHLVFAVWYRHYRVYQNHFVTNSFPTVIEPLILMLSFGWGLAQVVGNSMNGMDYLSFIAPAQAMMAAVYTSAFDESYGTYFRMMVDHNYDAMLSTPVSVTEVFWGELLYTGTKGSFFSAVVILVLACFGLIHSFWALLVPVVGFFTAIAFGSLGLFAARSVKNINQFNFFISGIISPLILFSGTFFSLERMPAGPALVAKILPLYYFIDVARMMTTGHFTNELTVAIPYIVIVPLLMGSWAVHLMKSKLIQ
jgi:lipooligosaccharide transport system permease protein